MLNNQIAKAKINLCLHVTGQRDDGYHLLDSLVVFADFGDALTFTNADEFSLKIGGPLRRRIDHQRGQSNHPGRRPIGWQWCTCPFDQKTAGFIRELAGARPMPPPRCAGYLIYGAFALPNDRGLSLGADVPVCLASRATRMQGIGNQLSDVNFLPQIPAVLVNSGDAVSTPTIFSSLDNKTNPEIDFLPNGPLNFDDAIEYLAQQRNDLEKSAIAHAPKIAHVLQALSKNNAALARMSGSGATCFGLYENHAARGKCCANYSGRKSHMVGSACHA